MKKHWISILIIFSLLNVSGCIHLGQEIRDPIEKNDSPPHEDELIKENNGINNDKENIESNESGEKIVTEEEVIETMIENMTIEEKIGQLIIGGFSGTSMTEEIQLLINTYKIGGFILFAPNLETPDQSLSLLNSIKQENEKNNIPLFLSVDQEGGRVTRLPGLNSLLTNDEIGQMNDETYAYEFGALLGKQLHTFGFNVNFAPVLDVNNNPNNPVIGDRSFGDKPEIVQKLGVQTMQGMQQEGVIPVVKHFPGHGDTDLDSHETLPIINKTFDQLMEMEIVPFKEAINSKADMVMTAHILLPELESEFPATMSKEIITGILREELMFNGVVITDDMTMGAITNNYEIDEAAVTAIKAGVDIVLIAHGFDNIVETYERILEAVQMGEISEKRIDKSVARILLLKNKYNLHDEQINQIDMKALNEAMDVFSNE